MSIYDNSSSNYSTSYIKKYLEKVVKVKMGVSSVSLPKWKGKERMSSSEFGSYNSATFKYKKITDYTKAVNGNYKALRNIITGFDLHADYIQHVHLGTIRDSSTMWIIYPDGRVWGSSVYNVIALRPAIEY